MNDFKEWLSDYLRYFMLAAALLLIFGLIVIGTNIYRSTQQSDDQDVIEILTETETERITAAESEIQTETLTESQTEVQSELYTEEYSETEVQNPTESYTENQTEDEMTAGSEVEFQTEAITETEYTPETETETETETEYVPKYKTLTGSCYIRSAPSMEAEILGEYIYGTTVEFIEDVGGWYKVQIDGMTGYMGARFFDD